jgi:hypothetical protein
MWAGSHMTRLPQAGHAIRLIFAVGYAAISFGALIAAIGLAGLMFPQILPPHFDPWALGIGAVLLLVGMWTLATAKAPAKPRPLASAPRGVLVIAATALIMAAYWATSTYAADLAERKAEIKAWYLWHADGVTLDTDDRLSAPAGLIDESLLPPGDSQHGSRFRYRCFRVLAVRGDRWVLASARWAPTFGYALIVTVDASKTISVTRLQSIRGSDRANIAGGWDCPEVAPNR